MSCAKISLSWGKLCKLAGYPALLKCLLSYTVHTGLVQQLLSSNCFAISPDNGASVMAGWWVRANSALKLSLSLGLALAELGNTVNLFK